MKGEEDEEEEEVIQVIMGGVYTHRFLVMRLWIFFLRWSPSIARG